MLHVALALSDAPWQLSVSLKSPVTLIAVGVSDADPVFVTVSVCAPLATPYAWLAKVSDVGETVADDNASPAVQSGIFHTPRP